MRCPGSIGKHRMNPHNGRTKGDYAHGMRGHVWHVDGSIRKCEKCPKTIKRLSEKKPEALI